MRFCLSLLLLCIDTMTKANLQKKKNIKLEFVYSFRTLVHHHHCEDHGGIYAGAWTVPKNYILSHRQKKILGLAWDFKTSNPTHIDIIPPKRLFSNLPNLSMSSAPWWLSIKIYQPMGTILIQFPMPEWVRSRIQNIGD